VIEITLLKFRQIRRHKLVANFSVYMLTDVFNKSIPFLLLPVMTRYLSPAEYGIVATYLAYLGILSVFTGVSVHGAVHVNYFQLGKDRLQEYVANCILILVISTLIVFAAVFITIKANLYNFAISPTWIYLGVLTAFCRFLTLLNLVLWQAEQNAKQYGSYRIAQTFTDAGLSLLLVVALYLGYAGRLSALIAAEILFGISSLVFIWKRGYIKFELRRTHIKDALSFGIPLIPHTLSNWLKNGLDRFFLMSLVGLQVTGEYAVGYRIGMIVGMFGTAFRTAWNPYLFKSLENATREKKVRLVKITYLYFLMLLLLAMAVIIGSKLLFQYFIGAAYLGATKYIFWIVLAYTFNGMQAVAAYIFYAKKTYLLAIVSFLSALLHALLSYSLIKTNGAIGAAWASTISFLITFICLWIVSAKVYPMPWLFWLKRENKSVCLPKKEQT